MVKVEVEQDPHVMDVITMMRSDGINLTLSLEPSRSFYARHMMAVPVWLIRMGLKLMWRDIKGFCLGYDERPTSTLSDALSERNR